MRYVVKVAVGMQADRAKRKQEAEGGPPAELAAPPEFEAASAQLAAGAAKTYQGHSTTFHLVSQSKSAAACQRVIHHADWRALRVNGPGARHELTAC